MKKSIVLGILLLCFSTIQAFGQLLDITYLDVPRQHMEEFLDLHKEMIERSAEGPRTITGHFVFAHAYAGPFSLVVVNRFDNGVDMESDSLFAGITSHMDSIADSTEKAEFDEKANKWFRWYIEGHWDEVRSVREGGFFKENIDPAQRHVVVVSSYNPRFADLTEFVDLYTEMLVNPGREAGYADGVTYSTHYRGSGPTFAAASWFPSWEIYAESLTPLTGSEVEQTDEDREKMNRLWEIAGDHNDDILVSIGSLVDGKFVVKEW